MLVLLTFHPKPSPGSHQVTSFTSEALPPTLTQVTDGTLTSLMSISPAQPEAPERQQLCPLLLWCQDTQDTCAKCRSNDSCLKATARVTLASGLARV